jgi:hypothetical protein
MLSVATILIPHCFTPYKFLKRVKHPGILILSRFQDFREFGILGALTVRRLIVFLLTSVNIPTQQKAPGHPFD